jgi:hypothetical protein
MKFLGGLFSKGWDDLKFPVIRERGRLSGWNQLHGFRSNPVKKWAHAGKKGKTIYCPNCDNGTHVPNFGWSNLVCPSCKDEVDKYNWLLPV